MRNAWKGMVTTLGFFAVLFSAVSSNALIMLTRDTTDIGKIVIVSPLPGDSPVANGTALINALNGITDASPTNQYVLKLGPGIYDVQSTSVQMKEFVDIEGSGEKTTEITGAKSMNCPPTSGTVNGADNAELRFLTLKNTGSSCAAAMANYGASPSILHVTTIVSGGSNVFGIVNIDSASSTMTNVTATASGGSESIGVFNLNSPSTMTNVTAEGSGGTTGNYGIYNWSSTNVSMNNVTATGSGGTNSYGIFNNGSSPTLSNVTATGSGGVNNYGVYSVYIDTILTVKINHSVIKGSTHTIHNGSLITTLVGNSQLDGGVVSNSGTLTCVGAYDENYVALSTTCQ